MTEQLIGIDPATTALLQEAADRLASGVAYSLEERILAAAAMDRIGDEIRAKHGVLDIGVPAIRELRDRE